jgi:N-acetylmuramoyl-L-alanine amidase
MRAINKIIIHCSATRQDKDFDAKDIDKWHRTRGWRKGIGYHFVITLGGDIQKGRALKEIGAHCKGQNEGSIGICYIGGLNLYGKPTDTRTYEQKLRLESLVFKLRLKFGNIKVHGHKEFSKKDCPCFDANEYNKISKYERFLIYIWNVIRRKQNE